MEIHVSVHWNLAILCEMAFQPACSFGGGGSGFVECCPLDPAYFGALVEITKGFQGEQ